MANKIKVNTGFKTYDIVDQDDKVLGQFTFNPSDTGIAHRYKEVIESLEKLELNAETDEEEDFSDTLKKVESVIFEKFNYLLGANVAETFFRITGPLSPLENGQLFIENVLEAIGNVISIETGNRVKHVDNVIKKHTAKYSK